MSEKPEQSLPGAAVPPSGFAGKGGAGRQDEASPGGSSQPGQGLPPDVSRETSGQGEKTARRNKRSSFYVYLVILFGAAFLMLLLAYFVQQRNNATVLADLRTTTASKDELLENIQRLERENLDLVERNEALSVQLDGLQEELDSLNEQAAIEHHAYVECYDRFETLQQFTLLEQALRDQDWDTAARRTRALCSGALELDMFELPGETPFDPRARLEEVIPLLEKHGALEPGEVSVPGSAPPN